MKENPNEITSTELIWPGKRTEVERVVLPFQTVETVNKPRVDQPRFDFGEWPENYPRDWKNKLIWGDNKYVMASLLRDFAGQIDLIYIDPPFATGADFTVEVEIGDAEVTKEASVIEELAYRDTWGKGLGSYLQMMFERLVLMRELLSSTGSIYVHCDWRVNSCVRLVLDEVFGLENFVNQVIWAYEDIGGRAIPYFKRKHDTILFYQKSDQREFNIIRKGLSESTIERFEKYFDADGRITYRSLKETNPGVFAKLKGVRDLDEVWLDKNSGPPLNDWWTDISPLKSHFREHVGFPTQKPEALLERIIRASSNEGDIVADFFCGSGTTGAVAEKLERRWIMSDLSRFAIQTTRKRLLNLHIYSCASSTLEDYDRPARPFEILNMGNYQKHKFIENKHPPVERYVRFILELYRAQPVEGLSFVHGKKGRRFVHVAGVDSIVTEREVRDAAEECVNGLGGQAIDVLGWDFEMGLDELVGRIGGDYGVSVKLVQIPREAMELRSADREIRFFDMNYLDVAHRIEGQKLIIELKDFIIANSEYLPDEVRANVTSFSDYIDYWAVDFDYKDDTFHNMWQSFRTRQRKKLDVACVHVYDRPGRYQVLIKVIDVFGNDTNKLLEVTVG
jgi:adenine-specific DNA-methyltransferase